MVAWVDAFSCEPVSSAFEMVDALSRLNLEENQLPWLPGALAPAQSPILFSPITHRVRLGTRRLDARLRIPAGPFGSYCPVTYLDEGRLVPGVAVAAAAYLGHLFIMASREACQRFLANPAKYLAKPIVVPSKVGARFCCPSWAGRKSGGRERACGASTGKDRLVAVVGRFASWAKEWLSWSVSQKPSPPT